VDPELTCRFPKQVNNINAGPGDCFSAWKVGMWVHYDKWLQHGIPRAFTIECPGLVDPVTKTGREFKQRLQEDGDWADPVPLPEELSESSLGIAMAFKGGPEDELSDAALDYLKTHDGKPELGVSYEYPSNPREQVYIDLQTLKKNLSIHLNVDEVM
jgi:hypothetical protein